MEPFMAMATPASRDRRPRVAPSWAAPPVGEVVPPSTPRPVRPIEGGEGGAEGHAPAAPIGPAPARLLLWPVRGERVPATFGQNARDLLVAALCVLIALLCWPA